MKQNSTNDDDDDDNTTAIALTMMMVIMATCGALPRVEVDVAQDSPLIVMMASAVIMRTRIRTSVMMQTSQCLNSSSL